MYFNQLCFLQIRVLYEDDSKVEPSNMQTPDDQCTRRPKEGQSNKIFDTFEDIDDMEGMIGISVNLAPPQPD